MGFWPVYLGIYGGGGVAIVVGDFGERTMAAIGSPRALAGLTHPRIMAASGKPRNLADLRKPRIMAEITKPRNLADE